MKTSSPSTIINVTKRDIALTIAIPFIVLLIVSCIIIFGHKLKEDASNSLSSTINHWNIQSSVPFRSMRRDTKNQKSSSPSSLASEDSHDDHYGDQSNSKIHVIKQIPFEKCGTVREEHHFEVYNEAKIVPPVITEREQNFYFVTVIENDDEAYSAALLMYSIHRTKSIFKRVVVVRSRISDDLIKMLSIFARVEVLMDGEAGKERLFKALSKKLKLSTHSSFFATKFVLLDCTTIVVRNIDDLFDVPHNSETSAEEGQALSSASSVKKLVSITRLEEDPSSIMSIKKRPEKKKISVFESDFLSSSSSSVETKSTLVNTLSPWYLVESATAGLNLFDVKIRALAFDKSIFSSSSSSQQKDEDRVSELLRKKYQPLLCYFGRTERQINSSFAHQTKGASDEAKMVSSMQTMFETLKFDPEYFRFSILQLMMRKVLEHAAVEERLKQLPDSSKDILKSPKRFIREIGVALAKV